MNNDNWKQVMLNAMDIHTGPTSHSNPTLSSHLKTCIVHPYFVQLLYTLWGCWVVHFRWQCADWWLSCRKVVFWCKFPCIKYLCKNPGLWEVTRKEPMECRHHLLSQALTECTLSESSCRNMSNQIMISQTLTVTF